MGVSTIGGVPTPPENILSPHSPAQNLVLPSSSVPVAEKTHPKSAKKKKEDDIAGNKKHRKQKKELPKRSRGSNIDLTI